MKPSPKRFQNMIWHHYHIYGRDMPWRINQHRSKKTVTPYHILVSELMLQQTQVPRVIPKYKEFIRRFPSWRALAQAPTTDIITTWKGLGYNRRAVNLKRTAERITEEYRGKLPQSEQELLALPGIGPYTAGALLAFAFNKPVPLIETNVRTVYLHTYFPGQQGISDTELLPHIERTLDRTNPREWYYALMDYGTNLKENGINLVSASKHYTKQSPFKGSNREARSRLLEYLMEYSQATPKTVAKATGYSLDITARNLSAMAQDGLVEKIGQNYRITQ